MAIVPAFWVFLVHLCGPSGPVSGQHVVLVVKAPLQLAPGFPGDSVVKNLLPMQEAQVPSLGWEEPLEKETATHSSILPWDHPTDRGAWQATVHGVTKSWT